MRGISPCVAIPSSALESGNIPLLFFRKIPVLYLVDFEVFASLHCGIHHGIGYHAKGTPKRPITTIKCGENRLQTLKNAVKLSGFATCRP